MTFLVLHALCKTLEGASEVLGISEMVGFSWTRLRAS
jgi:hypothetical protein